MLNPLLHACFAGPVLALSTVLTEQVWRGGYSINYKPALQVGTKGGNTASLTWYPSVQTCFVGPVPDASTSAAKQV